MKELIEKLKAKSIPQNRHHSSTDINLNDLQALLEYVEKLESLQSKGKTKEELMQYFESTGYTAWINLDLYPDGKIYTQEYTEWLEKQVLSLQSHAMKDGWVSDKMPDFDGKYLCLIEQVQECGAVWEYQKVVDCIMNTWVLIDREKLIAWMPLPPKPQV